MAAAASKRFLETIFEFGGKINASLKNALKVVDDSVKQSKKEFELFQKAADKFSSVGNKLTIGVTAPVVAAGVASVKSAMDFEAGTAKVNTMLKLQGEELQKVKDEALAFSNEYKISNDKVTEAMYQGLSAGIQQEDLMSTLGVAAKAAKGGFTDLATAIDGITNVVNSYGLSMDSAESIANQMLITQNLGKTTFGELASSMSKVTPIAKQANISTEELFSSMAVLTANGINTSEAVTGLKAALSNIIKPTTEATKIAKELGFTFDVATVQDKGLIGTIEYLTDNLANLSPEYAKVREEQLKVQEQMWALEQAGKANSQEYKQLESTFMSYSEQIKVMSESEQSAIAEFAKMFGSVEALNSIMVLGSGSGLHLFNRSMQEMRNNTTALDDAFNIMNDTTENTLEGTLIKLQNTAVKLGQTALPIVNKALEGFNNILDKFNNLSPETQSLIVKIAGAAALAGPAISLMGKSIDGLGKLKTGVSVIKALGENIGKTKESAKKAEKGVEVLKEVMDKTGKSGGKLKGIFASLGTVGIPVIAGIGALAATMKVANYITEKNVKSLDILGDTLGKDAEKVRDFSNKVDSLKVKLGALDATDVNLSAEAKATFLGEVELIVADVQNQIDQQLQEKLKKAEGLGATEEEKQRLVQGAETQKAEIQAIQDGIKALLDKGETQGVDSEQFNQLLNALEKSYMQASNINTEQIAAYQTAKAAGENVRAEDLQKVVQEINNIAETEKQSAAERMQEIRDTAQLQMEMGRITQEEMTNQITLAQQNLEANLQGIEAARGQALIGMFEEFGGLMDYINIETGEMKSGFIQAMHSLNLAQNTQKNELYTQYADLNQITDENMIRYVESNRQFAEMTNQTNTQLTTTGTEINLLGTNAQTATSFIGQFGGAIDSTANQIANATSRINSLTIQVPTAGGGQAPNLPKFAKGGIATSPSIFGEAGAEMAIPLQPNNPRSHMLLNKTASILGANNGGGNVVLNFSPIINGVSDTNGLQGVLNMVSEQVINELKKVERERGRLSY